MGVALPEKLLVKYHESASVTPCGNPPLLSKPAVASPTIFAAGIDVKFAAVNAGNVPVTLAAGIFVKFVADIAGNVPLNCAAGRLVKFAPLPL